ncbi:unnamed protein product [Effrenium voratum]|uniref:Uncharacterized protein n=1 Tax=Effrenium voratum TaxID=2562239 RepID=A0AA36JHF1_9DINO|nr:unnamed protein product [Effrenium voratum]
MEDGKHIDPRTRVECTQPEKVLDFRACPVKGGAKRPPKNDDIRKVVTKALADRGVPQPALPARVACVLSNVDPAHLRTHLHEPSHNFWSSLKKLASDAKIRLITPTELKEWQQTLRKRKQSEGPSQGSSSSHANSIRAIDVATITIDLQSFKAEGSKVSYLAPERFGPDQEGLAIMTKAAAEAFLPASRISAGPLAIAIVDTKPIAGLQQFMAPAFNHEDQPVLVPTCLGNAGIFLTPKGDDKKPHQAFAIIPLPTASLDDAVAKATSDPNILGVVEHSQHFALRCRRENLQKVRKILTPESLFVPEGEMPPDSEAFHLKHLTDHTTPEALTAALAQLG